jgi:hypothetical protein
LNQWCDGAGLRAFLPWLFRGLRRRPVFSDRARLTLVRCRPSFRKRGQPLRPQRVRRRITSRRRRRGMKFVTSKAHARHRLPVSAILIRFCCGAISAGEKLVAAVMVSTESGLEPLTPLTSGLRLRQNSPASDRRSEVRQRSSHAQSRRGSESAILVRCSSRSTNRKNELTDGFHRQHTFGSLKSNRSSCCQTSRFALKPERGQA